MSEDRVRLKRLLEYWIGHTHEHEQSFREWSERVKSTELHPVSPHLSEAADIMAKAAAKLREILGVLE